MKPKYYKPTALLPFFLLALLCLSSFTPTVVHAQGLDRWLGPSSWWDWSDYRFIAKYRFMFPTLNSGTLTRNGREHDLLSNDPGAGNTETGGYNFQRQPNYFSEGWFQLQVDRLGLRLVAEEDRIFRGVLGRRNPAVPTPPNDTVLDHFRVSELDFSASRLGLDLDVIRYPQFRFGFNFDIHLNGIQFNDAKFSRLISYLIPNSNPPAYSYSVWNYGDLTSSEPITLGFQALAIPGRIKEVPIILTARARFPMPFMQQVFGMQYPANITDWEVTAGLRPSIWETSAYKFATFSLAVEGGYRSTYVDADLYNQNKLNLDSYLSPSNVKAKFSGAFIQMSIYY